MIVRGSLSLSSVRLRLVLWSVAVMAVILMVMGGILRWTLQVHLTGLLDDELRVRAASEQGIVFRRSFGQIMREATRGTNVPGFSGPAEEERPPERSSPFDPSSPRVMNLNGGPYYASTRDRPWDLAAYLRSAQDAEVASVVEENGRRFRVLSSPLSIRGKLVGVVQAAAPLGEMERDLSGVSRLLLMLIPISLLIAGIGAAFLTGRLLQPVRSVRCAAARITDARLDERLPVSGGDEFADLAVTLNAMLDRIHSSQEKQKRFVADASHELRTPLTAIRAHTSAALRGRKSEEDYRRTLEALDQTAAGMGRVVQDLLLLARSDAGELSPEFRSVSAAEVFDAALDQLAGCQGPVPQYVGDPSIRVWADPDQLVRLFANLLENAIRHTPADGRVVVSAHADDSTVEIQVADTGCGIPAEHLPRVCDRFYRVEQSRARSSGGTGLGLAICSSIATAHNGSLKVESVDGKGTTVTVNLPCAPEPRTSSPFREPASDTKLAAAQTG